METSGGRPEKGPPVGKAEARGPAHRPDWGASRPRVPAGKPAELRRETQGSQQAGDPGMQGERFREGLVH